MHAQLETPDGFTLMASDTAPAWARSPPGRNFAVSLSGDDDALRGYWKGLAEGGTITMPLEKQMWGDEFGMLTDRFGIPWLVNIGTSATRRQRRAETAASSSSSASPVCTARRWRCGSASRSPTKPMSRAPA